MLCSLLFFFPAQRQSENNYGLLVYIDRFSGGNNQYFFQWETVSIFLKEKLSKCDLEQNGNLN